MPTENKSGPWSKKDKQYMAEHCENMSFEDIGKQLLRNPKTIEKYITETLGIRLKTSKTHALNADYNIKLSPVWKELEKQFSKDELNMFLYEWRRIISQFRDDVLPTEEFQIVNIIRLGILSNRTLVNQRQNAIKIEKMEANIVNSKKDGLDEDEITNLERQLGFLRAAQESTGKEHRELLDREEKLLKQMKGTREARIKELESSKQTLMGWIRVIINNPEKRRQIGIDMEKMRLAANVEYERLSEWHIYADGQGDQPILTPENARDE